MSALKHTPGPLSVLQNAKDEPTLFLVVAEGTDGRKVALAKVSREADAVLFAEAPNMLRVLRDTDTAFCVGEGCSLCDAIALAEGRKP